MFKLMAGLVPVSGGESRKANWAPEQKWTRTDTLKSVGFAVLVVAVLVVAVLL